MDLSVVIPAWNEAPSLVPLVESVLQQTAGHDREIILIDDGSTDGTAAILDELAGTYPEVCPISLERHRGKTAALKAGFEASKGSIIITLDSDGQDDPVEIPSFLAELDRGYDMICGWKRDRKDSATRVLASRIYNAMVRALFRLDLHDVNCGFRAFRREVLADLRLERDYHRLLPVQAHRAGHRVGEIPVHHRAREHGESKYGISRYVRGLVDMILLRVR